MIKKKHIEILTLTETQEALSILLKKVAKFLNEHNIVFFLSGGSALGAIRHQGFIPWDDDVDIMIPRREYQRFLEIVSTSKVDFDVYEMHKSPKFFLPFIKIADKQIHSYCHAWRWQINLNIDIFPIDYLPLNEKGDEIVSRVVRLRAEGYTVMSSLNSVIKLLKKHKKLYLLPGILVVRIFGSSIFKKRLVKKYDALFSELEKENAGMENIAFSKRNKKTRREIFEESVLVSFEGEKYPIVKNYHEYLTAHYGDYMKIPDEQDRIDHTLVVYRDHKR